MTKNQLALASLLEQKRKNTADITLARNKLAEEISNNLRNYSVNVSKNEIAALANEQLNSREIAKLNETIRSNLAKEIETNRHNLSEEEIKAAKNVVIGLKAKYSPGAIIAALLGLMPEEDIRNLYGSEGASVSSAISGIVKKILGGASSENIWDKSHPDKFVTESDVDKQHKVGGRKQAYEHNDRLAEALTNKVDRYLNENNPLKERNEIATDLTNSQGPSSRATGSVTELPTANSTGYSINTTIPKYERKPTSGGTDYVAGGGLKSSGMIISPGANF